MNRAATTIPKSDDIEKKFAEVGAAPVGGAPEQLTAFMASETAKWARVTRESGARID